MLFPVEDCLIQMGNTPALRNIEVEKRRQLFRRLASDGVAPGAEFGQLFSILVKGEIAVHHGRDADGPNTVQLAAQLFLHIRFQSGKAGLDTAMNHIQRVGPDSVDQLVFPFIVAGGKRYMLIVDQNRFDPR